MVRNNRDGGGNGSQWARICGKLAAIVALCLVIRGVSDMLESSGMEVSLPEGISEFILMSELPYHDNFKVSGTPYLFSELPRINHKDDTGTGSGDDTSAEVEVPSVPDISGAAGEGEITESEPQEPQESTDGSDSSTSDEPDAEPGGAIKTTITGEGGGYQGGAQGIYLKNKTEYEIDVEGLLSEPLDFSADDGARVLIVHTHGSEAYMPDGEDIYEPSDPSRTEDTNYNVVRVGDELEKILTQRGISVIHDRELYDYPSYNGSYTRSLEAIESYLDEYPDIAVVIDLHRDALEGDGTIYKTVADIGTTPCAQVMLVTGTNFSGLSHDNWQKNLSFALKIQSAMVEQYPTLARPLNISQNRYNQHVTTGSLIAEIGCNGNTLQEALTAVRYFGDCLADVLLGE